MLKEYKDALLFLVKYVVIYISLNTVYAIYISTHRPDPDPLTVAVTHHAAFLLSIIDPHITYTVLPGTVNVPVKKVNQTIIEVYEGCNGINVMVVFLAFVVSFKGSFNSTLKFVFTGLVVIYLVNLFRIMGLYGVALHFPDSLYFFHKFFFTGVIYLVVFVLWYYWVRSVKWWKLSQSVQE